MYIFYCIINLKIFLVWINDNNNIHACQNPWVFTVLQMLVRIPHNSVLLMIVRSIVFSSADDCQIHSFQSCMLIRILHYSQFCRCLSESSTIHSPVWVNACQNPSLFTVLQMLIKIPHYSQSCRCLSESPTIHSPVSANACQNPPLFTVLQMLVKIPHYTVL